MGSNPEESEFLLKGLTWELVDHFDISFWSKSLLDYQSKTVGIEYNGEEENGDLVCSKLEKKIL